MATKIFDTVPPGFPAVRDTYGQEILLGDMLFVAFRDGNTAEIRVGTVEGFSVKKRCPNEVVVLNMDWSSFKNPYGTPRSSTIESDNRRFIKASLPEGVIVSI